MVTTECVRSGSDTKFLCVLIRSKLLIVKLITDFHRRGLKITICQGYYLWMNEQHREQNCER